MMRFSNALALAAAMLTGASLEAQQRPTFSSKTSLLTMDVTALDRDGKPVAGLTANDFEVKVNGSVQPVRAVAYLEGPRANAPAEAAATEVTLEGVTPRRTAANRVPPAEARIFVLLVDDLSFIAGDGKALFVSASQFLSRLPAADYVGYAATSGIGIVNPTRDRSAVATALRSAVGQMLDANRLYNGPPSITIDEALRAGDPGVLEAVAQRECYDLRGRPGPDFIACQSAVRFRAANIAAETKSTRTRQVRAYESVIESLRGAPGIKHLVLLSNGLAVTREIEDLVPVARAASAAGVEISMMVQEGDIDLSDVGGSLETSNGGTSGVTTSRAAKRRQDQALLLAGGQTMTDMAGGQFYRVIGQPKRFFDRVETTASAVYRLGVELPPGAEAGRDIAISARVKRDGVTAITSRHASVPLPDAAIPPAEQMKTAVTKGQTLYGVPISAGAVVRRAAAPGQLEIAVTVDVPAGVNGPLSTMFGLVDSANALKSGSRQVPAPTGGGSYRVTFSLPVAPGAYSVRFAVTDAAGNVGSVSMPVFAALTRVGPFDASDVMLWAPDSTGRMQLLGLDELSDGVKSVTAMVELYPAGAPPPDVTVRFALLDAAGKTITEKDAVVGAAGLLRAEAALAIDTLPAGTYAVRATVSVGGAVAGQVTTTIRKR